MSEFTNFDKEQPSSENRLSLQVDKWSEIISACEHLCLLATPTILASKHKFPSKNHGKKTDCFTFLPALSAHQLNTPEDKFHPTTTAQCVSALRALAPVIQKFEKISHESSKLPFHNIDYTAAGVPEKLEDLYKSITDAIDDATNTLSDPPETSGNGSSSDPSSEFGNLHPYTCANILRAISPGYAGKDNDCWWRSFFIVLWFLSRARIQGGNTTGTASDGCPATAYMVSRCIDAVETVIQIWSRRKDRFDDLIRILKELHELNERREDIEEKIINGIDKSQPIPKDFTTGVNHQKGILLSDLQECLKEWEWDAASPKLFTKWKKKLFLNGKIPEKLKGKLSTEGLNTIGKMFKESVSELLTNSQNIQLNDLGDKIKKIVNEIFSDYKNSVSGINEKLDKKLNIEPKEFKDLPDWVQNGYRFSGQVEKSDARFQILEKYWYEHADALKTASEALKALHSSEKFITEVLSKYSSIENEDPDDLPAFIDFLNCISNSSDSFTRKLKATLDPVIHLSESHLTRQLAYYQSGSLGRFDPGELAHSLLTLCRHGDGYNFDYIVSAMEVICKSQHPHGTWPASQPFFWRTTGLAGYADSLQTAWTLVLTVRTIVDHPDKFGVSIKEVSTRLEPAFDCLYRVFQWLNANLRHFDKPPGLPETDPKQTSMIGWGSDRLPESGIIHNWVGATAIEFLVEYRALLQELINSSIRERFLSYSAASLHKMNEVDPTDLNEEPEQRTSSQIKEIITSHKMMSRAETNKYFSKPPSTKKPSKFSFILYGPPGTSKTFMAKAVAGELGWPLIVFSPSDFLAGGEAAVEIRSREIFKSLNNGSRLVYFFDEIDELILDRSVQRDKERSIFTFLTPSFLTKLQDLRDAAKKRGFIFIIGTNYLDRIDPAAKRGGRIDEQYLLAYPDTISRTNMILNDLRKKFKIKDGELEVPGDLKHNLETKPDNKNETFLSLLIQSSALLSYEGLKGLCKETWENRKDSKLETKKDKKEFAKYLENILKGENRNFKREFEFSDYANRPKAKKEFAKLFGLVFVKRKKSAWDKLEKAIEKNFGDKKGRREIIKRIEKYLEK